MIRDTVYNYQNVLQDHFEQQGKQYCYVYL